VGVAVPAQRGPQAGTAGRWELPEQPGQVRGLLAGRRLRDGLGGGRAYPRQGLQRALAHPPVKLTRRELAHHLGRPAEGPHPVGRRAGPFELERDLPQRLHWIHLHPIPRHPPPGNRAAVPVPARGRPGRPAGRAVW